MAIAMIAVDQHTYGVASKLRGKHPRRSADTSLELVADHAGASADCAFFHFARRSIVQRCQNMLFFYVPALQIIERTVATLTNNRQTGVLPDTDAGVVAQHPGDGGIVDSADGERVGEQDGGLQKSGFLQPIQPSHTAISVKHKGTSANSIVPDIVTGDDGCDTCACWSVSWVELAVCKIDRGLA